MSVMCFISFPRDVAKQQPNATYIKFDDGKFTINPNASDDWRKPMPIIEGQIEGRIDFGDTHGTIFNDCFKNPFVYELYVEIPDYYYEQRMEITDRYMGEEDIVEHWDDDAMTQELCKYWSMEWYLRNEILYKYLYDNLAVGDFVEIYESWTEEEDEGGVVFGPPTSETVINLDELLSLPYQMGTVDIGERKKLTIHRI